MTSTSAQTAPNLLDLLTRPREFFTSLRHLPARNGRYFWLVLLTGLVSGLYSAISQKPVQDAMQGIPGAPSGSMGLVFAVLGSVVVTALIWLLLWGLGSLGAGKEGRSSEVFGASFLPSLVVALVLLPLAALFPLQIHVAPPNLSNHEVQGMGNAIQQYSAALRKDVGGQPLSIIGNVLSYGAMAYQFYLAFVGFNALTSDRSRALKGTLMPLGVIALLGGAFWLIGKAAISMMGAGA